MEELKNFKCIETRNVVQQKHVVRKINCCGENDPGLICKLRKNHKIGNFSESS